MIETLIGVIVWLIIVSVIWWAVTTILGIIPMPAEIKTVVNVLLIVVLVLIILYAILPLVHVPVRLLH